MVRDATQSVDFNLAHQVQQDSYYNTAINAGSIGGPVVSTTRAVANQAARVMFKTSAGRTLLRPIANETGAVTVGGAPKGCRSPKLKQQPALVISEGMGSTIQILQERRLIRGLSHFYRAISS
jgi:hypothetical protein